MLCRLEHGKFHTYHMPWADGTECGKSQSCEKGKCVEKEYFKQIDGKWNDWITCFIYIS